MDMTIDRIKEENGMTDLKGSKTYENLLIAFAGSHRQGTNILFLRPRPGKKGIS